MLEEYRSRSTPGVAEAADDVPWGIGTAFAALAVAFFIYVVADTILAVITGNLSTRDQILFSLIGYQGLALGVAVSVGVLIYNRYHVSAAALGFRFPGFRRLLLSLAALIPTYFVILLVYALFSALFPSFQLRGNAQQELPLGHHVGLLRAVSVVFWGAVEAPLVEETLFRGIIFQGMHHTFGQWFGRHLALFAAALGSGLLFGLAHFQPHTLPILAILGISLAYIFYYARSIYASALVHGVVNFVTIIAVLQSS
ncbi:MAG TPA: CPBP family intramembrane glutamic endopeptidase [Chloroflexota bacterium]